MFSHIWCHCTKSDKGKVILALIQALRREVMGSCYSLRLNILKSFKLTFTVIFVEHVITTWRQSVTFQFDRNNERTIDNRIVKFDV
jgi:hypothetical protein